MTLRAVGKRAGISRQAPYGHFADKEALLSALAVGYFGRLGARVAAAAEGAGDDPAARLGAIAEAYASCFRYSSRRYPHRKTVLTARPSSGSAR